MILFLNSDQSLVARVGASPTSEVHWTAHFYDSGDAISEDSNGGELNGTTYVTLVAAPSTKRGVKEVTFHNPDTGQQTVELTIDDNGTKTVMFNVDIEAGESLLLSNYGTKGDTGDDSAVKVFYAAEITDTANLVRNDRVLKTSLFNNAADKNLTLLKADWEEGDWMVIRQFGDGQATIVPEDANVKLPDKDSTPGKGQDIFIECYDIDGDDKYFHITNGVINPE